MTNKSTLAQRLSHAWPWTKPIGSSPTTSRLLRYSLLCMLVLLCGGSMWAEDVTVATGTFNGKKGIYTEGWTTTGTGKNREDCIVIGSGENITSPSLDLSQYSKVTISINARRYGNVSNSKATIDASINSTSVGTTDATGTNAATALTDIEFTPTATMTAVNIVFTCTNATSAGSTHGAGINTITITGTKGSTEDTRTETTLTFTDAPTGGNVGNSLALPAVTVMAGENEVSGATITWSSSNDAVAKIEGNNITLLKAGTAKITATYAGNESYKGCTNDFTLTVAASVVDGVFDFTTGLDYGSGDTPNTNNSIANEKTWIAGNVVLNLSGKNCWWNSNGTYDLRLYSASGDIAAGTMTFSVPTGKVITKIAFEGSSVGSNLTTEQGIYKNGTWTGSANTVTITSSGGSTKINTITVTYGDAPAIAVVSPTFSPAAGTYYTGQEITLSCETEGADIYKSTDGENFSKYTSSFPVTSSTTVYAYAEKDGEKSETVSATYLIGSSYDSFAAMQTDAAAEGFTSKPVQYRATGGMTVAYVNGKNAYLIDGSGNGILAYNKDGLGTLAAGQKMNYADGYLTGTLTNYQGNAEIEGIVFPEMTGGTVTVTPVEKTLPLTSANQSTLVTLKGVTYNSTDKTLSDGTNTITFFDKFKTNVALENDKTYDVTGIVVMFNTTIEICPRTVGDVVEATPAIETVHIWANVNGEGVAADDIATVSQALFGRDSGFPANYTAVTDKELFTLDEATEKYTLSYTNVNVPADGMGISWAALVNQNGFAANNTFGWADISKAGLYDITFTYDPTATENQLTATATKKDFYILGVAGWSLPADLKAMTWDGEKQAYTYELNNTTNAFFCFSTNNEVSDWNTFNSTYRWALGNGGDYTFDLDNLGTPLELSQGEKTIKLPAGEWTISVTADKKLTITGEATPVTPTEAKYYVVGTMTDWQVDKSYEMTRNESAANEEYSFTMDLTTESQFKVVKVEEGKENVWYPNDQGNYGGNGEIVADGNYTIYFRPNADGGEDWFYNVIYVAANEPEPFVFRDIKLDLTVQGFLTDDEYNNKSAVTAKLLVDEEGNISRNDDATEPNVIVTGNTRKDNHGWDNFTMTVPVTGKVKITIGGCEFNSSSKVLTVTPEGGEAFTIDAPAVCWHNDKTKNVKSGYFDAGENLVTLTITGPEYTPYVAIEAVDEIPSIYTVTYAKDSDVEGTVPAEVEVTIGEAITLPKNYTLYKEGYTQTGWTDGATTYELGGSFTPEDDVTLTAVFTENTVNLADRTEAVTVTFALDGSKAQYGFQGGTGIIVTQTTVNGETIDVKAATSGKFAYNGGGWHQMNNGSLVAVPSCKDATIVVNSYYNTADALTFAGSNEFDKAGETDGNYSATYTATTDDATVEIAAIKDNTYINSIVITLPKVESTEPGGETLEDIEAIWSWKDGQPATITSVNIENSANPVSVASTVEDINMTVIATSGKLKANGDNAQYNAGTKLQIPVVSKQDVVTVVCHAYNFQDIKVGGTTYTTQTVEYTATAADVTAGFVEIEAIHDMYLYSVKVKQVPSAAPTTLDNKEATVTWALNAGNITDAPTYAEGTAEYFVNAYIALGDNFTQASGYPKSGNSNDSNGTDQTLFNPATATTSSTGEYVEFMIKPKANFKPTNVSFSATRYGTDAPTVKAVWVKTDGTEVALSSEPVAIARNKKNPNVSTLSYKDELSAIDAARGICGLRIYVTCANNKQVGFNNVQITGTLNGEVVDAETATINVTIDPEGAGEVAISPKGTEQEVGTEITLKQTKNFGYAFDGWYINDEKVGSEDSYTFELNANTDITAKYTAVETYALTVNVEGGNSYQVTASPEATDGKYEAGTEVTLTAVENPVVKFTNWSTSATEKEIKVTINEDTEITANFAATDEIVAAWDFYEALGNSGKQDRAAAFKGENNDGTILTLRNAEGTSVAWLDRNYTNPYNGAICAINWQKKAYGEYYWQTKVNASSYKTMKVYSEMYYNYRAYNKYDVQYSVDGTEWTTLGTFELSKDDWSKLTLDIPEAADNKEEVYVRWIKAEDAVLDETASDNGGNFNDGIGIANIFITGTKELVDDGTAPVLQSQVPAANSENASINGQVVLTFDEKIQLTGGTKATLGEEELEPIVAGKALMFKYQGLDYDTEYTFTLPANFVSDLMNNTLEEEISFTFKTMTRPTVTKAAYDFIVPDDGTFAEAVAAANSRSDKTKRYFIFVKKGEYKLMGTGETENAEDDDHNPYTYTNRITDITASNISIIGEDRDATILYNSPDHEGIGVTATLRITKDVENTYIEDITIKNAWEYTGTTGRAVTIQDKGTRTIAKNVKLLSYQDTYYSNNQSGEFFFEDGEIHGTVDFVCGTGDVIYKDVTLYLEKRTGNVISAPNQPKEFGYVFLDCTIDGDAANEGTYYLGRPWGTGVKAQFVNTQMKVTPAAAGWTEMGAGRYPAVFAEFNSYKEDMSPIDLSGRKTSFGASNTTTAVESSGAELTTEQVASLTVQNIFGDWLPTQYTIQEEAPSNVKIDQNGKLTWDADDYALCYVVCADGNAIAVTTENSFDTATAGAPALRRSGDTVTYTVRAANAMGGLGEESTAASPATGINATLNDSTKDSVIYDLNGRRVMTPTKGVYIINGKKVVIK